MARIPTYQKDTNISDLDRIIGTDGDTNELVTKNFYLGDIAEYVIDRFIDPDATSFKIPVFRDTQDTEGANATRITNSIIGQDEFPNGSQISIGGNLVVGGDADIGNDLDVGATTKTLSLEVDADAIINGLLTMKDEITMSNNAIVDLADPVNPQDAATKAYVDSLDSDDVTGTGTTYTLPMWTDGPNGVIGDSQVSQNEFGTELVATTRKMRLGFGNTTNFTQKILGDGVDSSIEPTITSFTNVVLGEGSYNGTPGARYYKDSTAILDRVLKLGNATDDGDGFGHSIGVIHIGDPEWVRSNPYTNYSGMQGYFPTFDSNGTLYASRWIYVSSIQFANGDDWQSPTHVEGARYQQMFDPQFGTTQGGRRGDVFGTSSDANCSAGVVEYRTASQNYDYTAGANTQPGSQGIFTFDARTANSNDTAVAGTSLFLLKSGYGNKKFEIKQNSGGATNPGPALIFGKGSVSSSENSVAMGNSVVASGLHSFAIGNTTTALGEASLAGGTNSAANNVNTTAIGFAVTANGENSQAFGINTQANGLYSFAANADTQANQTKSFACGAGTMANGEFSFAGGANTQANHQGAVAFGGACQANGEFSFVAGNINVAGGNFSTAFGLDTNAGGQSSTALGHLTRAVGIQSMAINLNNETNADNSFAFGNGNTIISTGIDSVAGGRSNTVSSENSIAFGQSNDTSTSSTGVVGTTATEQMLFGRNLLPPRDVAGNAVDSQFVVGKHNNDANQPPTAFVVGTGVDASTRKNSFTVHYSGDVLVEQLDGKNYTNDTDAAAAGIPTGGLYRNGNDVKVNFGSTAASGNEGLAYLTPQLITAAPAASDNVNADHNLVLISWSGANGNFTLNLPLASANTNRLIRITTDGSLSSGAGDKIDITATGGETIDGNASFQISKQYEGLAIFSTGSEWIIVQAKAH